MNGIMPAKDFYHDTVCTALIKDGWTITNDPFKLKVGGRSVYVDLGAKKLFAADRSKGAKLPYKSKASSTHHL